MRSLALALLALLALAGCAPGPGRAIEVRFADGERAQHQATVDALLARYAEFRPSAAVEPQVRLGERGAVIDFAADAPPDEALLALTRRGKLRLGDPGRPAAGWFSEADIGDVVPWKGEAGDPTLLVALRPQAAGRMLQFTRQRRGKAVVFYLDGDVLSSVRVAEPFSSRFELSMGGAGPDAARHVATVLKSGPLPAKPESVRLLDPGARRE
jgi:preprotein translocase subunit SecD